MDPSRIAALLAPFLANDQRLTTGDLSHISTYIDILLRWNARINLTAIRDAEPIVTRHFGESLFLAQHLFPHHADVGTAAPGCSGERSSLGGQLHTTAGTHRGTLALQGGEPGPKDNRALAPVTLADVGSGAGFPGIPIKLWAPHISLTLIESNQKKATFLREVARALTLTDINIQSARAETLPSRSFDVVTLRAVERFETVLPIAARLVRPGGRLALLIGSAQASLARHTLPSLLWSDPIPIPNSRVRILLLAQTPIPQEPEM